MRKVSQAFSYQFVVFFRDTKRLGGLELFTPTSYQSWPRMHIHKEDLWQQQRPFHPQQMCCPCNVLLVLAGTYSCLCL